MLVAPLRIVAENIDAFILASLRQYVHGFAVKGSILQSMEIPRRLDCGVVAAPDVYAERLLSLNLLKEFFCCVGYLDILENTLAQFG